MQGGWKAPLRHLRWHATDRGPGRADARSRCHILRNLCAFSTRVPVEQPESISRKILGKLHELMLEESSLDFGDFAEVAEAFIASYAKFMNRGADAGAIGAAMLSATVNMYDMFEMTDELPALLRMVADKIECEERLQ